MGRGALWRDNQQSTFAHTHTSSSHSTTSPWSPIPYPHCVSTRVAAAASAASAGAATDDRRAPGTTAATVAAQTTGTAPPGPSGTAGQRPRSTTPLPCRAVPRRWRRPEGRPEAGRRPRRRGPPAAGVADRRCGGPRRRDGVRRQRRRWRPEGGRARRRSCPRCLFGSLLATQWRHNTTECRQRVAQASSMCRRR